MKPKALCDTCKSRVRIETHETGLQFDVCAATTLRIDQLGIVTKCSKYSGLAYPYLFVEKSAVLNLLEDGTVWWTSYSSDRVIRGTKPKE